MNRGNFWMWSLVGVLLAWLLLFMIGMPKAGPDVPQDCRTSEVCKALLENGY